MPEDSTAAPRTDASLDEHVFVLPSSEGERRTVHQFVRDTLRQAILGGAFPGGSRLVQAEIAEQMRVSTTPVREALRDLAAEGLIRLDAHRGAIVHEYDLAEVREIYDLRRLLEPEAMRRAAARITREELEHAAAVQARMDAETDSGRWVELNRAFHGVLTDAARSSRLSGMLKTLRDSAAMYVGLSLKGDLGHLRAGNADHHALLDACRERDADRAAELVIHHLDATMEAVGRREPALAPNATG